ncbi:MAG: hypothetical protein HC905_09775 [Bacteroidales bacterium]|nr:hypothetical protein [Bacteroidales bacterium]
MIKYLLSLTLVFLTACSTTMHTEVHLASRENNVCKNLIGNVVVYAIFVDSKYSKPWSEYDIQSTLDSINKGMNWLMAEARKQNHYLNIEIDHHKLLKE